ncbi:hypothetical protein M011DRAFT_483001 [Sporormia fimetaria CBS 119925]|uniref:Uncharacterized protein n=1 Tax=Sporormia fimetaria CBS 119925 TaxID=1340428 RepID=A0A6A6VR82_9PLEO|nr:hypothetical protein M011DRAFT_483001 [Sporormia fimetaria CBS 119925]
MRVAAVLLALAVWARADAAPEDGPAAATAIAEGKNWTPKKAYAEPFEGLNNRSISNALAFGSLVGRQTGQQCSTLGGEAYNCGFDQQCCRNTAGCCDGGPGDVECVITGGTGIQGCCPLNEGYVTCGGTTCVWGRCCQEVGTACAGLSQCCKEGGCCDDSEECCGDVCCRGLSKCCGGKICCDAGFVCEAAGRCVPEATSAAATTIIQTVVAKDDATKRMPSGCLGAAMMLSLASYLV